MTMFKTTWDSFNYRVKTELIYAKDNDVDTNELRYNDIMEHLVKYRRNLENINDGFQRPHNFFYKRLVKKFSKLEKRINDVYQPLIKSEQE